MSSTEFSDLSRQLDESNTVMKILGKLVAIEDRRQAMELALKSSDYTVAATKLDEIQKLMATEVHERFVSVRLNLTVFTTIQLSLRLSS